MTMELFEALAKKRACRDYAADPVPAELIERLIYAFGRAPTASNRPYRHCIVVDDAKVIRAVRRVSPSLLAEPPLLLVILTDLQVALDRTGKVAEFSSLVDSGAAGENVLLAATALGLGSQFTMIGAQAAIRVILGLPEHCRVDLIIPLGTPASPVKSVKAPASANRAYHNQYGTPYASRS
jgi:nitroreductase